MYYCRHKIKIQSARNHVDDAGSKMLGIGECSRQVQLTIDQRGEMCKNYSGKKYTKDFYPENKQ